MSGILRLANDASGQSTLDTNATTDVTYSLPDTGADGTAIILTDDAHEVTSINWDGIDVTIQNGDINLDNGTLFVDESTNHVGIGTTSPASILTVHQSTGNINLELHSTSSGRGTQIKTHNDHATFYHGLAGDTSGNYIYYTADSKDHVFLTSDVERVRIDSDGRVGIGTTSPGSFDSASNQLVIQNSGNCGITIDATSSTDSNIYFADGDQGNERYRGTITYSHSVDAMRFGTGGGNEAMRIDSSGRLLVGTISSSTADSLVLNGNSSGTANPSILRMRRTGAIPPDTEISQIEFASTETRIGADIKCQAEDTWATGDTPGRLVFSTTADGASSPTERMRITAQGFIKASNTGSYVTPTTGISATQHEISNSTDARDIIQFYNTHASDPYGIFLRFLNATPNNTTNYFLYCMDGTAQRVTLRSNGGIANYQSNNANLCDEREKKNIETLDSTWNCLKEWKLKKFHYNEDADTSDKRYGVIAQQIAEYCPEVITDWVKQKAEEAVLDDDGNIVTPAVAEVTRMGVKEQQMMWMAIKALQEAMERIETLETEVSRLRSN